MDLTSHIPVSDLPQGGMKVGDTQLDREQLSALVERVLSRPGEVERILENVGTSAFDLIQEELGRTYRSGDRDGFVATFGRLSSVARTFVGMERVASQEIGRVPPLEGLGAATEATVCVLEEFGTESHNAQKSAKRVQKVSQSLGRFLDLRAIYQSGLDQSDRNVAPVAREGEEAVRAVFSTISPVVHTSDRMAQLALPMRSYVETPVLRAQETKRMLGRDRAETASAVTEQVLDKARTAAREELRTQVGDRLDDLLSDK